MKPYIHAQASARRYGGVPEDYLPIHDFMDSSKAAVADWRHRAIFHNAFGVFVVEKVFGHNVTNSAGKLVSVRDVAEDHVREDLGFVPSLEHWLRNMKVEPWMGGRKGGKTRHIPPADKGLGEPKMDFKDTFSAEDLVIGMMNFKQPVSELQDDARQPGGPLSQRGGMSFDRRPEGSATID